MSLDLQPGTNMLSVTDAMEQTEKQLREPLGIDEPGIAGGSGFTVHRRGDLASNY